MIFGYTTLLRSIFRLVHSPISPSTMLRSLLAVTAMAAVATARPMSTGTFCADLQKDLPHFCVCAESPAPTKFINLSCNTTILGVILDVGVDISPCAKPDAHATFYANVTNHVYSKSFTAGEKGEYAIPGLAFKIPVIGEVGAIADYDLEGNGNDLKIYIGIDACAGVGPGKCASDFDPKYFPLKIINDTIALDDCSL
eukprot:m.38190 g.38190  ORF g.38190 m.38190 type:complete len:198 (-) comp14613_c0_seq3:151-744(-)